MSIRGIDVSEFQGNIDWNLVKNEGVQFVMLRAGYGQGNVDTEFRRNASECNRLGIPFGVYWFSYAYNEEMARTEAEYCIGTIAEYQVQYPVCYDFEEASVEYAGNNGVTVTQEMASAFVDTFCRRVEELGYFAMYYSNLDYLDSMFDASLRQKYALWYAQYATSPSISGLAIWQDSDSGVVNGISGNVDTDIAYYDLAETISKAGLNHLEGGGTPPAPEPAPQPEAAITYTIRPGDTLSEIAQRYGTTYQQLAQYNGISNPNLIYAGEQIQIPGSSGGTSAQYYTIRYGDTLSQIALRFGTTVTRLQQLNGISDPNQIYAGTRIRIK